MTKSRFIKHPIKPTDIGMKTLRARLSMGETQTEFAARFYVTFQTIHNWETGKVIRMQKVYANILDTIVHNLKSEGRWLEESMFRAVYRTEIDNKGIDLR